MDEDRQQDQPQSAPAAPAVEINQPGDVTIDVGVPDQGRRAVERAEETPTS